MLAIDPGALVSPIPSNVEHYACTVEACTPQLLSLNKDSNLWVDMVVCDMNVAPVTTVDVVYAMRPLLRKGCGVVLTFKNFVRGKQEMLRQVIHTHMLACTVLTRMCCIHAQTHSHT